MSADGEQGRGAAASPGPHAARERAGRGTTIRSVQRARLASTVVLNAALLVLGLIMLVLALARGGGALALGTVVGVLFAALGAGRLWIALRGDAGGPR